MTILRTSCEQSGFISDALARRLIRNVSESQGGPGRRWRCGVARGGGAGSVCVFEGDTPQASSIKLLERYFREARESQRLLWAGDKLAWELAQSLAPPELPLWMLSLSVAELMTSDEMHKLRECGNAECRWLFLDTSKNHTRRWCDMKICGNRMKARRFKAQHRGDLSIW